MASMVTLPQDAPEVMKQLTVRLPEILWAELRKRAIDERTTARALLLRMIRTYIEQEL